jgi:hypothetical protein
MTLAGLVESLWRETEPLGLRNLLIEPGRFRTQLLSSSNLKITKSNIPDYEGRSKSSRECSLWRIACNPAMSRKACPLFWTSSEQRASPLGRRSLFGYLLVQTVTSRSRKKYDETLRLLDEWKDVINSTNYASY